jgi:hypothetical protein
MTAFRPGDRIRYETIDDDGFPFVRYGFVGGEAVDGGPVVVMLDGELAGAVVDVATLAPVHIGTVSLVLDGRDLLEDPSLRQGLVNLWLAEAEDAGLQIGALRMIGTGVRHANDAYVLAELDACDENYVLKASACTERSDAVIVRADRPTR